MKFVLYIDYLTGEHRKGYEYIPMKAKNILEAIHEADAIHNPDTMYLVRIMQSVGKVEKENGYKTKIYKAIECKRTKWHENTEENGEQVHFVKRCYTKDIECFEAIW